MSWLSAEQALNLLGTKSQTLYANVSRGRIRAKPDPADTRRSLYFAEDVDRLAKRQAGRRKNEAVATETIRWGDPLLSSGVSTVVDGRLFYRGKDAAALSDEMTLEDIATLLWDMPRATHFTGNYSGQIDEPSIEAALVGLARRATSDLPSLGRARAVLQDEAESVLSTIADALAPGSKEVPVHERLAASWKRPEAADVLRRALILLADHELNASTFAARVTASAGATLSAAALSGLATLTGPLHGGAWQGVVALATNAERLGAREAVRLSLAQGYALPAFGHRLYPEGDIRAKALLAHVDVPPAFSALQDAAEDMVGERANVDFALSAVVAAFDLPPHAPLIIFALARSVGWLAHAMEQAAGGRLIRPRARYTGPDLGS